ncbi:MAG: alanyl-tRNA editing protein [Lachnospiraceae bacterium]|nr:alanyl-tRNA editing protein [Lachnospiraceae bacterium]
MTEKLYEQDAYLREFFATVLEAREGKKGPEVRLDRTAFYPEGGGQPFDTGCLGAAAVLEVHEREGEIWHLLDRALGAGAYVRGVIDWERRFDHMQQHSGEHIVSGMICARYHCSNVGFHLGREVVEIDFDAAIPEADLEEIENAANRYLWEDHEFEEFYPSPEELAVLEYRSKKALEGEVRIARWPGADTCACCGTHVHRSGEVGQVLFLSSMKNRGGTRITMVCGKRAYEAVRILKHQNDRISHLLSAKWQETADAAERLARENEALRIARAQQQTRRVQELLAARAGEETVWIVEPDFLPERARELATGLAEAGAAAAAVFFGDESALRYCIASKEGLPAGFAERMRAALGGRGGGKNTFLQGSVEAGREAVEAFFREEAEQD